MKRNLTCIICPRGCLLEADIRKDGITISGNSCPKGEKYAVDECTAPMRTVTSTVHIVNRENTMLSVKTSSPIPKEKIFEAMQLIRGSAAEAPVHIGDIIIGDVFGSDIIATKNIE